MNRDDILGVIEAKYGRYVRSVIDEVSALPNSRGERDIESNAWQDWLNKHSLRDRSEPGEDSTVIHNACRKLAGKLPEDELALLWMITEDYATCTKLNALRAQGEALQRIVADELYRHLCQSILAPRVSLPQFIVQLVNNWESERLEEPDLVDTAVEVTRTIWGAEDNDLRTALDGDADATTIANVIEARVKERFGGHKWREMSDYINQATPGEREQMHLQEFSRMFHNVLQGYRRPTQAQQVLHLSHALAPAV